MTITLCLPQWINDLPAEDQGLAQVRYIVRLAAMHATPGGSVPELSLALGLAKNSLHSMYFARSKPVKWLAPSVVKGIEQLIGAGCIPREMMNPEVYGE